jgi:hypothetical protein
VTCDRKAALQAGPLAEGTLGIHRLDVSPSDALHLRAGTGIGAPHPGPHVSAAQLDLAAWGESRRTCWVVLAAVSLFERGPETLEEAEPEVDENPAPRELHEHDKSGQDDPM